VEGKKKVYITNVTDVSLEEESARRQRPNENKQEEQDRYSRN